MSIEDFSSEFGTGNITRHQPEETWFKPMNGNEYLQYATHYLTDVAERTRFGKSTNPIQHRNGYSWRNPSDYERAVTRLTGIAGSYRQQVFDGYRTRKYPEGYPKYLSPLHSLPGYAAYNGRVLDHQMAFNELSTRVLDKLGDEKTALGSNLAQAVSTYNTLVSNAIEVFKTLRALKDGGYSGLWNQLRASGLRRPRDLNRKYLEFIYGISPLMSDIHGGWELLNQQLSKDMLISAKASKVSGLQHTFEDTANGFVTDVDFARIDVMKIYAKVDDVWSHQVQQAGMINPASVAWDLLPYSFVFDWICPVGNVLMAMTATSGLSWVGGSHSAVVVGTRVFHKQWLHGFNETIAPAGHKVASFGYRRVALPGFPEPRLYVKDPFTSQHSANAIALFWNALK